MLSSHQRVACSHTPGDVPKLSCCALQAGMWIGIAAGALLDGGMHVAADLAANANAEDRDAQAEPMDVQPDADGVAQRTATQVGGYPGVHSCIICEVANSHCLQHLSPCLCAPQIEHQEKPTLDGRRSDGKAGRAAETQGTEAAGRGGGSKKHKKPQQQHA